MREYIKIVSKDGKAVKNIPKDEYPLYAQGGWTGQKEGVKKTDYTASYSNSSYTPKNG